MNRIALADRIINYSDALAAFSLVNALAFIVTLAEPEIRCSIVRITEAVIATNVIMAGLLTAGLIGLRRFELSLRADVPESERDDRVERFWRVVHALRIVLVWGVVTLVLIGLIAATHDPVCA